MRLRKIFNKYISAAVLICGITFSTALTSYAVSLGSGSQSYRVNVLNAVGVADSSYLSKDPCTRAEFAKLMVLASSLRDTADAAASSAVTKDVAASYKGSGYIRAALSKGWMRTRLGGSFAPDEPLTLSDAVRASLKALGYEDADFGSDIASGRMNMYKSLELDEGVSASAASDKLSKQDALNIMYNLLRTKLKDGSGIYGAAVKLKVSTGNELDVSEALEESLIGPVLVKNEQSLPSAIPFYNESGITIYYNGNNSNGSGKRYLSSQLNNYGWVIVYYNEKNRSVWAYGEDTGNNTYHCVRGNVNSINYENDNIASPSSVVIGNTEYKLDSSEVKFMFSVSGDVKLGDNVILICKSNVSEDGSEAEYYAVAVVEYYQSDEDKYSNVIYAEEAGKYTAVNKNGIPVNE